MVTVLTFGHTWGHDDCIRFFQHVLGMDLGTKTLSRQFIYKKNQPY